MKLKKCLIANRGEIAVRIIRACAELGIAPVAVYSEPDAAALHVRLAAEAYPLAGTSAAETYLNIPKLLHIAADSGCDCVHPGYGFLSENEDFAAQVIAAGLVWVGPSADAIRRMGVKTEARALMQAAGVPVVPGFQAAAADDSAYQQAAHDIGYPVMVKAAGGGGGKGIRIVSQPDELPEALAGARREALKAFGDDRLFLERYIEQGHHIEIQVLADHHGNLVHLFERECSVQRRHQKIIEESPAPLLDEPTRQRMGAAALEAARAVGYVNAGTVEFIVTPDGTFYFLEMNTRLQVEHPVTEAVTGLDVVKLQFHIAAGEPLPFRQSDVYQRGHSIECRLYAEDPANEFLPSTGRLEVFNLPQGPGIRVDSGVRTGDVISRHYDPMIAKIIVCDVTRAAAIQRMLRALEQTVVLGVQTNLAFLQNLLRGEAFPAGAVHTRYVDQHLNRLLPAPSPPPPPVLIAAALVDALRKTSTLSSADTGGDAYSPWSRSDGFRIGGRS